MKLLHTILLLVGTLTISLDTTCMLCRTLSNNPQLRTTALRTQQKRNWNNSSQDWLQHLKELKKNNGSKYSSDPDELFMRINKLEDTLGALIRHLETNNKNITAIAPVEKPKAIPTYTNTKCITETEHMSEIE